jgi:glutamate-ammonia-ligase adenylyltransferase
MFLIGTRILSGTVSAEQAGEAFARVADVLMRSLHEAVEEKFATLHGRVQRQEVAILALGKLGGREMTATSDLDLIVVYDFDADHPESDGPRPLYGGQYFARSCNGSSASPRRPMVSLPGRHGLRLRPGPLT